MGHEIPNRDPLVIARCINSSHSQTRLILGECYGIHSSELYYGIRYVRVYQIPPEEWSAGRAWGMVESEDKLFRIAEQHGEQYVGEFSSNRFEPIHTKAEMEAETAKIDERQKFISKPGANPR